LFLFTVCFVIVNCLFLVVESDALLAEVLHELDVGVEIADFAELQKAVLIRVERLGDVQCTVVVDLVVCHSYVFCGHVVLDCGPSLAGG